MEIKEYQINNSKIAEIIADQIIINNAEDALDLMGNLYYQAFEHIILHEQNITPAFFELKNGMAGEILQKFSNYRIRLTIIGNFSKYESKSLKDFIYESNNGKQINFLPSIALVLKKSTTT